MISTAYVAHYSASKFYTELKNRSMKRYNVVVGAGFAVSLVVYVIMMCAGFLTFGGNSTGFILNNYASSDILATFARLAMGLGILCGYPLTFVPLREGMFDMAGIKSKETKNRLNVPLTAAVIGILTAVAVNLDNAGSVIGFSGALVSASLIYLMPAVLNIFALHKSIAGSKSSGIFDISAYNSRQRLEWFGNIFMAVVGTAISVIGVGVSLYAG